MTQFAFETRDVRKSYGDLTALDGVSLRVAPGEIVGFVGPNGSGKSTLLKLLTGAVHASGGEAYLFGTRLPAAGPRARARIGYVPGDLGVYRNRRAGDFLRFCMGFYPAPDFAKATRLARDMGLPLRQRLRAYSTGMRQKIGILQALCVNADLLLLDEPTRGLDPTSQAEFLDLLTDERRAGRAILLSSHVLEEVERVCDRIAFIHRGRLVSDDHVRAVKDAFRRTLRVTLKRPEDATALRGLPGVAAVALEESEAVITLEDGVAPLLAALARLDVLSLEYNRPTVQDLYRALYREPPP